MPVPVRSIILRESEPKTIQLSAAEAQALNGLGKQLTLQAKTEASEESASAIRCVTSNGRDWSVSVDNSVGVVCIGDVQLVVEPKIPRAHLLFLFSTAGLLPRSLQREIHIADDTTLIELVATWFIEALEALLHDDLIRDYAELTDLLPAVRGTMHPLETARHYYAGVTRFSCTFEQFEFDNALNRILKAGARIVMGAPLISNALKNRSWRALARFDGVGALREPDLRCDLDRRTAAYRDSVQLGKLLIQHVGVSISTGSEFGWTFLLPTPNAVERGIRSILADWLAPHCSVTSGQLAVGRGVSVYPDLLFAPINAVGDVKYKILNSTWNRHDLYQIVSFASAYKAETGIVVAFEERDGAVPPVVQFGGAEVTACPWTADETISPQTAAQLFCVRITQILGLDSLAALNSRPALLA